MARVALGFGVFLAIVCWLALVVGYGGALHPAGDSLAVARVPAAFGAALFSLAFRRRGLRAAAVFLAVGGVLAPWGWGHLAPQRATPIAPRAGEITLYQQNLLQDRTDRTLWLEAARASGADLITVQEVSHANLEMLETLRDLYPYLHYCPVGHRLGEAVLSRLPIIEGSAFCSAPDALAGIQVQGPTGPLWVVSLHIGWPWPYRQARQLAAALPLLHALPSGPVVVGGDFNSVAWSHSVAQVERATQTRRLGRLRATFTLPKVGVPVGIDHVLGPAGGTIEVQREFGSDHRGLLARVRLPAP